MQLNQCQANWQSQEIGQEMVGWAPMAALNCSIPLNGTIMYQSIIVMWENYALHKPAEKCDLIMSILFLFS